MNTDWQDFLETQTTNDATGAATVRLIPLTDRGSIAVSGEEAGPFLQALLTQEVLLLDGTSAARTAFCNAKGRTYTTLTIHPLQQPVEHGYRLTLPANLVNETLKLLRMYVLRRKVELDGSEDWVQIGLIGRPQDINLDGLPTEPLGQSWLTAPGADDALLTTREDNGSGMPRFSIQGPWQAIKGLWQQLAASSSTAIGNADEWQLSEIDDGLPQIAPETWGHFVPQWLNLDLIEAVSFKKGCYPGQEIVARMHYLGKPNRRMLAGHINRSGHIQPGTQILLQDGETAVGEVVRSAPALSDGNQHNLLAVIRLGHVNEPMQIDGEPLYVHHHEFATTEDTSAH